MKEYPAMIAIKHLIEGNAIEVDGRKYIYQEGKIYITINQEISLEQDISLSYFIQYFQSQTMEDAAKKFIVIF